jgi:PadR family transcriptional regulator AphA
MLNLYYSIVGGRGYDMSSLPYAFLSLLARQPLSGYDIKQQMNSRLGPFWNINNNQLYPILSQLEAEGLIELQSHEQISYRPARKVYAITEAGKERLREWVMEPSELTVVRDEFLLKFYNSWFVDPDRMMTLVEEQKRQHEKRLAEYLEKVAELRERYPVVTSDHPIFSTLAVIEMGIAFERSYMAWCDQMIAWLKEGQA